MKALTAKIGLCILAELGAMAVAVWWGTSHVFQPLVLFFWPGVVLAMLGATHTWILPTLILLAAPVGAVVGLRRRPRWLMASVCAGFVVCYYGLGVWWYRVVEVPLPLENPYAADTKQSAAYQTAYQEGYRHALSGSLMTYCFRPEAPTRGFYKGAMDGHKVFCRVFNQSEARGARMIRGAAAIDGVPHVAPVSTNQLPKPSEPSGAVR
ncbi:MAG: hypothetical protein B9S33_21190 [Pedosphaera sp. Tous-C6FEB]|nr:MAG: hypothetical protein B9S33_21190 [Pedosphaera sp. Tous-C6FEB]